MPGKKLPIWKKRETQVNTQQNELDIKHEMTPPKSYGKKIENGRQLREIQENANFEKLRVENSEKDMSVDEIKEFMDDQRVEIDEDDYYDNDAGLDYDEALEDLLSEVKELEEAEQLEDRKREIGDVIFSIINVCRYLEADPEIQLNKSTQRFIERAQYVEKHIKEDSNLEKLWQEAKKTEEK